MPGSKHIAALLLLTLAIFTPAVSHAQYDINLFAGSGPNNLAATQSSISSPVGVAADALGNFYSVDPYTSRVYKVDSTGTLTVFAGNGALIDQGGYSGDGGPAIAAQLSRPEDVAVDANGNVYIADSNNSVIRCVVAVSGGCGSSLAIGSIITVVGVAYDPVSGCEYAGDGGPAIAAKLCQPNGIFFDTQGDLYVADTLNDVIRCVVASANGCQGSTLPVGSITTVAGNANLGPGYSGDGGLATSAQFDEPDAVAVDGSGNIYIADTFNSVIRCVVGAAGGCFGSTLAVGDITTVAGVQYTWNDECPTFSGDGIPAISASLCLPQGIFTDSSGNVYVADTLDGEIREIVASTAVIQAFAGMGGTGGYTGDGGPATSATLLDPIGLFIDANSNVYIADWGNYVIREVSSGTINTVAGNHVPDESGDGAVATNASLNAPGGTAVDALGNIFIADTFNCVIREVAASGGTITSVAGNATLGCGFALDNVAATSAEIDLPGGVFVDSGENVYIADTFNDVIRCVVGTAGGCMGSAQPVGNITTVAGTPLTPGYAGDNGAATSAQLYNPASVYVDAGGDVFIADTTNSIIRCVVGTAGGCFGSTLAVGYITTVAGTPGSPCSDPLTACGDSGLATAAQLNFPSGVYGDAGGDIFIADTFDSKIRCIVGAAGGCFGSTLPVGSIVTVAGTGVSGYSGDGAGATSAMINDPYGLSVDSFGNIFIADTFNSAVREVVAVTGDMQTAAGNGTEGYAGDGGAGTSAVLANPLGLAGDSLGNIYVADTENSRVRELTSTVAVTSIPTSATLPSGATQQFAAIVTGAANRSVTWQVNSTSGGNSTVGTISAAGSYQAPTTIPASGTVTVRAISNANGVNLAAAPVTIVSASSTLTVTVSTSPTATEVYTGTTQSFTANVTGNSNTAVNWQVNGGAGDSSVGTISSSGVYTAPASVSSPALVVIGAVSQASANVSAVYPVTIVTAPTATQAAPQTISPGGTANYSIALNANTGDPSQPITLSCLTSTLPGGASCVFTPATITPGAAAVPFTLSISVPSTAANARGATWPLLATFVPMVGLLLIRAGSRKRRRVWLTLLALAIVSLGLLVGCGGGSSGSTQTPKTYSVPVQGTTVAQPNPATITTVSLTVQ
jgi:hypothetical protein